MLEITQQVRPPSDELLDKSFLDDSEQKCTEIGALKTRNKIEKAH